MLSDLFDGRAGAQQRLHDAVAQLRGAHVLDRGEERRDHVDRVDGMVAGRDHLQRARAVVVAEGRLEVR